MLFRSIKITHGIRESWKPMLFAVGCCPISAPRNVEVLNTVSGSTFGVFVHIARFRPMIAARTLCTFNAGMNCSGTVKLTRASRSFTKLASYTQRSVIAPSE